jgi:ABC-type multidrug transport system fused ATPase/permease subunit
VFEDTIAQNIAYGRQDASQEEIETAAHIAELHESICQLPKGYHAIIGPQGIQLSTGQKQQLAIARAVLADPAILLMDEATSSLDTEAEKTIQKALANVMAGRTSFIIAHRLSTIVNAEAIVVMEDGKIVEMGTHDELMNSQRGYYRGLYLTQFRSVEDITAETEKEEAVT